MAAANHELARADYLAGMKYKDIAAKYGVSINTVKSWAKRHGWTRPRVQPKKKTRVQPDSKGAKAEKRLNTMLAVSVEEADDLSDRERDFCLHYIKSFNATQAYLNAFGGTWASANAHAWEVVRRPAVRAEIQRLKAIKAEAIMAQADDVVEMYMRIAFADLKDYVEWGRVEVPVMGPFGPIMVDDGKGNKVQLMRQVNDVRFVPSDMTDGQIISEVKVGKDGASIKLADRMAALKWLSDYFELNPKDRHRDEYERRRLELEEKKAGDTDADALAEAKRLLEGIDSAF